MLLQRAWEKAPSAKLALDFAQLVDLWLDLRKILINFMLKLMLFKLGRSDYRVTKGATNTEKVSFFFIYLSVALEIMGC